LKEKDVDENSAQALAFVAEELCKLQFSTKKKVDTEVFFFIFSKNFSY